jgi:arylsulfatase A-like enzyme
MRPQLGCYGHAFMHTPHLDQLAATGTLFNRAYVQYAFCAPSRNSFMTGRRPDRTRVWNFMQNFRQNGRGGDWTSLPQNFKRAGYLTMGTGKTFHPGDPIQFDYPHSWSYDEMPYSFGAPGMYGHPTWPTQYNSTSDIVWCDNRTVVCANGLTDCPADARVAGDKMWASCNMSRLGGQKLWDQEEAAFAIKKLRFAAADQAAARGGARPLRPFFLAVGFHRPHIPWIAPTEFFDLYPPASRIAGPTHPNVPTGMPPVAWHSGGDNSIERPLAANLTNAARRGLYATMSYVDSLVGDVLAELTALGLAGSTIVSFVGDHGQHVGEQNLWEKMTNFENGVRIPFLLRVPWLSGSVGRRSDALVEIVDLYKTLSELAGIPLPTDDSRPVQGVSLVPALTGGPNPSNYSFSQFAKSGPDTAPFDVCMSCFPDGRSAADFMGFSVRSAGWRYTEWYRYNKTAGAPNWRELFATELYDHRDDHGDDFDGFENVNVAINGTVPTDPSAAAAVAELKSVLLAQFQHDAQVAPAVV